VQQGRFNTIPFHVSFSDREGLLLSCLCVSYFRATRRVSSLLAFISFLNTKKGSKHFSFLFLHTSICNIFNLLSTYSGRGLGQAKPEPGQSRAQTPLSGRLHRTIRNDYTVFIRWPVKTLQCSLPMWSCSMLRTLNPMMLHASYLCYTPFLLCPAGFLSLCMY
jgi:hypothetical protein